MLSSSDPRLCSYLVFPPIAAPSLPCSYPSPCFFPAFWRYTQEAAAFPPSSSRQSASLLTCRLHRSHLSQVYQASLRCPHPGLSCCCARKLNTRLSPFYRAVGFALSPARVTTATCPHTIPSARAYSPFSCPPTYLPLSSAPALAQAAAQTAWRITSAPLPPPCGFRDCATCQLCDLVTNPQLAMRVSRHTPPYHLSRLVVSPLYSPPIYPANPTTILQHDPLIV